MMRKISFFDKIIQELDNSFKTSFLQSYTSTRKIPKGNEIIENEDYENIDKNETKHIASLMRINHTGEVCAQALYRGQAFFAKNEDTRKYLLHSADEEHDHLYWCQERIKELNSRTSYLNFFWYLNSFFIGSSMALISDKISLGFVIETENQVMKHLKSHLEQIPSYDFKSHAILNQMYIDEKEHAENALNNGGINLPFPIKLIMKIQSKVMTKVTYYI